MRRKLTDLEIAEKAALDRRFKRRQLERTEEFKAIIAECPPEFERILHYARIVSGEKAEAEFLDAVVKLDWLMVNEPARRVLSYTLSRRKESALLDDPLPPETNLYLESRKRLGLK